MARERIVTSDEVSEDQLDPQSHTLRPRALDQYIGQSALVERIRIALDASRARDEPIDHVLLHGPPGLGKTTLARHVVALQALQKLWLRGGYPVRYTAPTHALSFSRRTDFVATFVNRDIRPDRAYVVAPVAQVLPEM